MSNKSSRQEVYNAIDGERDYQATVWNETTTTSGGEHSMVEFLVYIQDYTTEALHVNTRKPDQEANVFSQHSLRKIAALAVAALEQHGVKLRNS